MVGVGNVAMDVARILAKSVDELKMTDIADHALDVLAESKIKDIYIVARHSPAQVKFTNAKVREFGHLAIADAIVLENELRLDRASSASIGNDTSMQENLDYISAYAKIGSRGKPRRVHFRFLLSPTEIVGRDGKIVAVTMEKNRLRATQDGDIKAAGTGILETKYGPGSFCGRWATRDGPLEGVPFDARNGVIPNDAGRVLSSDSDKVVPGEYTAGSNHAVPPASSAPTSPIRLNRSTACSRICARASWPPAQTPIPTPWSPCCGNGMCAL